MQDNTDGKRLGYWLTTGVLAVVLLAAGIMNLMEHPAITEVIEQLGYPAYLIALLGVTKLLAAIAILIPNFPRLKEWAYAGIVIDFGGAMYSHLRMDQPEQAVVPMLLLVLVFASWYLRPDDRKLSMQDTQDTPPT